MSFLVYRKRTRGRRKQRRVSAAPPVIASNNASAGAMAEVFALPELLSLILLQLVPHADALLPKCSDILRKDAKLSL
jgi:hypothetical protein